jgi:hypothetical protein
MTNNARFRLVLGAIVFSFAATPFAYAADPTAPASAAKTEPVMSPAPATLVDAALKASGGKDKILTLFSMKEVLILGPDGKKKGSPRSSVLEPPKYWWLGGKDRAGEPAKLLVWVWTLGAFADAKSKLAAVPELRDGEADLVGLEITGSVDPAMKVYFDKKTGLIARIDWKGSLHRFSEWKELDGLKYPSRTVGSYAAGDKPWYQTDITEIVRLKELPEGLMR